MKKTMVAYYGGGGLRILLASILLFGLLQPAHAVVIGTENFDGGVSGWNWDFSGAVPVQSGASAEWSATVPTVTLNGSNAAQVTNTRYFHGLHTDTSLGNITSASRDPLLVSFEITPSDNTGHSGLSFFNNTNNERIYWGVNTSLQKDGAYYLGMKTYNGGDTSWKFTNTEAVVGNSYQVIGVWDPVTKVQAMWAWDITNEAAPALTYQDLFSPHAYVTATATANVNNIRISSDRAPQFDNIAVATEWTDFFGPRPQITRVEESFAGYTAGSINNQFYRNFGQAPAIPWAGNNATVDNAPGLVYNAARDPKGLWAGSDDGYLRVGAGGYAKMNLDLGIFDDWGLLGTDGQIGGTGIEGKDVYLGFLVQGNGNVDVNAYAGMQLYSTAKSTSSGEVIAFVQSNRNTSIHPFGSIVYDGSNRKDFYFNSANADPGQTYETVDNDVHLIIAKITYQDGFDDVTVWLDPDLALSELDQSAALTTNVEGISDLRFDHIYFRNSNAWDYDEFRIAASWNALTGAGGSDSGAVPEPATWVMLLVGGVMIFRIAISRRRSAS